MATLNLGRLKPVFRSTWNSSTSYNVDDIVVRNNQSYISIQAGSNQDPATATAYWTLMAAAGTDVGAALANKEIAFKTNAGAVDGIPIGNAGEFLKVNSGATGYEFAAVVSKVLQAQNYEYTTRASIGASTSDQNLHQWTTSFVKQSATSKLYIWNMNPTFTSNQGSQQVYQKFAHSDGTTSEIYGSRLYYYTGQGNSTAIGMQGVASGLKTGTYSINLYSSSRGNNHNGSFVINPTSSDDNRHESSADNQGATGTDSSKSTLIVQEIEV